MSEVWSPNRPDEPHLIAQPAARPVGATVDDGVVAEGGAGELRQLGADVLQDVGEAIDHLLGQSGEGLEARDGPASSSREGPGGRIERRHRRIANRGQGSWA